MTITTPTPGYSTALKVGAGSTVVEKVEKLNTPRGHTMDKITSQGDTTEINFPTLKTWKITGTLVDEPDATGQAIMSAAYRAAPPTLLQVRIDYDSVVTHHDDGYGYVSQWDISLDPAKANRITFTIESATALTYT
jgi:hypothetical protein